MARKDKFNIQRPEDYSAMDEELTKAMDNVDEVNQRVANMLDELMSSTEDENAENGKETGAQTPAGPSQKDGNT